MWHFPRSTPGELEIDSRGILAFLDAVERYHIDVHSLMILRHGKVAAEGYWTPYAATKTYTLFSASKSFTAMAVGFAVQDGLLSMDSLVLPFFADKLEGGPCENMRKVTVRHLMMMGVGFDEDPHDFPFEGRTDWIKNFLTAYVPHEPGSKFVYSTHASYMLSAIVQKVTGRTVWAYLREKLFDKLGFSGEWWEESPQGISVGGWGLMVTTEDFAKLGQFLLNKGWWQGERLLDEKWVEEAVSCQISNAAHPCPNPADAPDFQSGYGYQIWRLRDGGAYMASGGFGQDVMVFPERDAVIAMTCGTHGDHLFESLWKHLYPSFLCEEGGEAKKGALPSPNCGAEEKRERDRLLKQRMDGLQIPCAAGAERNVRLEALCQNARYLLGGSRYGYTAVSFDFSGQRPSLCFEMGEKAFSVSAGYEEWVDGRTCIRTEETDTDWNAIYQDVSCCAAWDGDVFELRMVYDHTPFYDIFRFHFDGPALVLRAQRNVWHYGEYIDPVIYGVREEVCRQAGI